MNIDAPPPYHRGSLLGYGSMLQETVTVTIPKDQHDKLLKAASAAEMVAQRLRDELEVERAKTETERLEDAKQLLNAFRVITDHAIANLSPEFIVDLPAEAFFVAAAHVDKVIAATQRDGERGTIWRERADDIVKWRERRKARDQEGQTRAAAAPPANGKPKGIFQAFTRLVREVTDDVDEFRKSFR